MHRANNVVIMQTEQLGRIEALEEELRSFREKAQEQDRVITQLVGDNLKHLQDNMRLTAHINSSQEQMGQLECHRYDFLVRLWNGLIFFELFKLYFHLGLITTPHVLYVPVTYVYSFSHVSSFT